MPAEDRTFEAQTFVSLRPVARLLGEEPADPPGRFHDVSSVARDEVKMRVGHSLAGYLAAIDSQVHSFEAQTVDEPSMKIGSQGQHLGLFVRSQAEEIRLVALGNYQRVARTDGVCIREGSSQWSFQPNVPLLDPKAERALVRFHDSRLRRNESSTPQVWATMMPWPTTTG